MVVSASQSRARECDDRAALSRELIIWNQFSLQHFYALMDNDKDFISAELKLESKQSVWYFNVSKPEDLEGLLQVFYLLC